MEPIRSDRLAFLIKHAYDSCDDIEQQEAIYLKLEKNFFVFEGRESFHESVVIGAKIAEKIKLKEKVFYYSDEQDNSYFVVATSDKKATIAVATVLGIFKANK